MIGALLLSLAAHAADVVPWSSLQDNGPDAVYAVTGLDDAFVAGVGYRHVVDVSRPLVLSATADVPWADFDLADHRVIFAASMPIVSSDRWMLAGRVAPSWRRVSTHMNTMGAAGVGLGLTGGFNGETLFVHGALGSDVTLGTRIVHADTYRELVYADAVDGWYRTTGVRWTGELHVGAAFDKVEVGLRTGQARSLQLETGTIPLFAALHVGWRL